MRKRTQSREYALQVLYQVDMASCLPGDIFSEFWRLHPSPLEIKEFAERLVMGTCEECKRIDALLSSYAENWNLDRMAVIDRNILRFATYELLYMDDIPPKVTINEAVNIAKKYSQEESGKFVNGVLDKICRAETKKTDMNKRSSV